MLKLNTDAMILWQMVMSVAKDTTVAKAFSILTPNALPGEIESNSVISAASSLSTVTDVRSWESREITTMCLWDSLQWSRRYSVLNYNTKIKEYNIQLLW